ncbi:MAG: SMP-30/gluconolactonase/LRE family protein [Gammaproteobacteria bacterium]|nr:SMP-30/gluconolactonase/LRE family protein [Gammaproteobacteria bacterium]MBU1441600.1 SMP-30/gluconolactonase/LRE family protein [Gammaproteobacteria bacterium]MBU2409985.1 SMP-30/gluconolactonase/LRE family protein [Gammaproteobacteria bacterium]
MNDLRVLLDGFTFLECPRWHAGLLWVSEMHSDQVLAISEAGRLEAVVQLPGRPGGLGWLPDGRMLVVSTEQRQILRVDPDGVRVHADLGAVGVVEHPLNDMTVGPDGRCYVGEFGVEVHAWMRTNRPRVSTEGVGILGTIELPEGSLFVVEADGRIGQTVPGFRFPNGSNISADGSTFVVAETLGLRLSILELALGRLRRRETWDLGFTPDGISERDSEGCIWVADPVGCAVRRVAPGGRTVDMMRNRRRVYACAMGGSDGRSLFLCTSSTGDPRETVERRDARIEVATVQVGLATRTAADQPTVTTRSTGG